MKKRHDRQDTRRTQAKERQEKYEALSPAQRLQKLDERLGVGEGAKKERKRLLKALGKATE